ncbi:MAG TPA: transketolase [Thermoanaerobaculia bacterium]|nr:transketolase [Thermoanaerobaculia bacterium]
MDRDRLAVNTLRFLAVDMVERARSGHPGAPLGLAPVAHVLWSRFLRFDPADPLWPGRDRFVLSCGHASALLYALLHLAGFDLPLAELERFRQLGSRTPGHPEHGLTPGVETTTGPLGQGVANAVGMALGARLLGARFDRPGRPLFAHSVWALASDGDLMEGVASEACSLAGHQRLGALKVIYDDNRITIDGPTDLAFSERVGERFAAYGWRVLSVADGNDLAGLERALGAAAAERERPTLVVVRTEIGFGSPNKQGTSEAHGSPLGAEETRLTKEALGWPPESDFRVPEEARAAYDEARRRGATARAEWIRNRDHLAAEEPELAAELVRRLAGELPEGWDRDLPTFPADAKGSATRVVSGQALNLFARRLPELAGGSADLTPSNNTHLAGEADASPAAPGGRNLRFGVREHGMGAILNGLALAGGVRPFGATFLVFSDYMRPAIRLAALMELPVVYVFTHDSVFLGEDGPTHQPVDQLASLRAIPGLAVLRPADANETVAAWRVAIGRRDGPTALALTRQKVPVLPGSAERAAEGVERGGYVLAETGPERRPDLVLLATGSEVALALGAAAELGGRGVACRVVSLPSWELFARQERAYRDAVLPPTARRRLAVEAGASLGWHRWAGAEGAVVAIDRFGASAPDSELAELFGMTVARVVERASRLLDQG